MVALDEGKSNGVVVVLVGLSVLLGLEELVGLELLMLFRHCSPGHRLFRQHYVIVCHRMNYEHPRQEIIHTGGGPFQ